MFVLKWLSLFLIRAKRCLFLCTNHSFIAFTALDVSFLRTKKESGYINVKETIIIIRFGNVLISPLS